MSKIIDLTLPVKKHWRWTFSKTIILDYESGGPLLDEMLYMDVHGWTHMDPPLHAYKGRAAIDQVPLDRVIGKAKIVDLSHVGEKYCITDKDLEKNGSHVESGDIVLIKTCQGHKYSWETPDFWLTSPYMDKSAGNWLISKGIAMVGFDFPQDYVIRDLFTGRVPTLEEMVMHKLILGADIVMVEYLTNLHLLTTDRVNFYAIPMKLEGIAGAPTRAFAFID